MPWTHFRPTPDQIAESCRTIREDWDEITHRQRWVFPLRDLWRPPLVRTTLNSDDDRDAWITSSYLHELSG